MSATQVRTALLQNLSPFLNDVSAMRQINDFVVQLCVPSPCEYSQTEAQQRVQAATARSMAGEHGMCNADFKAQVRSWYK